MSTTKIYNAGPITGYEETAKQRFEKAEKAILDLGFEVVNPMNLPHIHDKSWNSYMKECLFNLVECDGILMLRNYHKSKGALLEQRIARDLGLTEYYESGFPQH